MKDRRFRLNGLKPSNRLPAKHNLRKKFSHILKYSPDELPSKADLRSELTPVEDQSQIGSCSANCLAGAYEYLIKKHTGQDKDVSRLFMYYNGRMKENDGSDSQITDSGCSMTVAIEALEEYGACPEPLWPYDIAKVNVKPFPHAYQEAKRFIIDEALQIKIDLYEMKSCLAQGFPFAFGLKLFESFDKAAHSGVVPMPSSSERSRQSHGSHALLAVGFSDTSQSFIVRNSWGDGWGDRGYCYIPYDYLTNSELCFDSWTIRKISNNDFGSDHWDNEDSIDYSQANNWNDNDNIYDEDNNGRTIEHLEDDDDNNNQPYGYSDNYNNQTSDNRFGINDGGWRQQRCKRSDDNDYDRDGYSQNNYYDDNSGYQQQQQQQQQQNDNYNYNDQYGDNRNFDANNSNWQRDNDFSDGFGNTYGTGFGYNR
ncbi:unnamed protein product [Didymodactylos carnosus]|uniref:Peptidase C1A papain C-terminal domain-containing protein n=2 Tax=Didymodactylos carnosus TaxID=1234261 RepID=A0A814X1N2_9BILA|nr:unnamed protein product [Didymodactylos carnosus]CAF3969745.1 unnamed protein product [Didymodactylos carnosus]